MRKWERLSKPEGITAWYNSNVGRFSHPGVEPKFSYNDDSISAWEFVTRNLLNQLKLIGFQNITEISNQFYSAHS